MAAMAWPRARPNVLHPRQYGGINLERAYWSGRFLWCLSHKQGSNICNSVIGTKHFWQVETTNRLCACEWRMLNRNPGGCYERSP